MTLGLIGKLPAHGDFVRRGDLPAGFCGAWDAWLQDGMAAARATIGEARWPAVWDAAPAWRFVLPAGACGPDTAAGVLLPCRDTVGRRWPLTLAAVGRGCDATWPAAWFAALEGSARSALAAGADADAMLACMPMPGVPGCAPAAAASDGDDPLSGFWAALAAGSSAADPAPSGDPFDPTSIDKGPPGSAGSSDDPSPSPPDAAMMVPSGTDAWASPGWWTASGADGTPGLVWALPTLPAPEDFVLLLEAEP